MDNLFFAGMFLVGMLIGGVIGFGSLAIGLYYYNNMNGNNKSKVFARFDEFIESEEDNNE